LSRKGGESHAQQRMEGRGKNLLRKSQLPHEKKTRLSLGRKPRSLSKRGKSVTNSAKKGLKKKGGDAAYAARKKRGKDGTRF